MYYLREIEREDIPEINKWRNDKEIIDNLGAPFRFINQEVDTEWFNAYMKNRSNTVRCAIVSEGIIIGMITLANIDYVNRACALHIMVGEKSAQGKGAGTYAVNQMIKHAFNNLNMNRIELGVLECNERAIGLYEKCGFRREGIKRQAIYKNGKYINMIIMSVLKDD